MNTGLPAGIERSYIYVGTTNGRLDQWRDRTATAGEAALAECAMLADTARNGEGDIARLLHREITTLSRTTGWHMSWSRGSKELLGQLDLPADVADRRWATRFELSGKLHEQRDALAAELTDFQRCVAYGDACEHRPNLLLRMAQIQMSQGNWEEALQLARSGHDLYLEKDHKTGLLEAIGSERYNWPVLACRPDAPTSGRNEVSNAHAKSSSAAERAFAGG